ncbi:hypothetical protein DSM104299_01811 [Baekduia alba]|uniref:sulfite exporter TauE/SafE family protein n=1 Tax=Baekduia alba TaxID=2997333 RepID=UPI0023417740|nr:sulfite exporter TauE/SafE family protein [Baekduia alba]WCB93109.1 hypothetical protein DSM104299_01811 [Baekduia alba]
MSVTDVVLTVTVSLAAFAQALTGFGFALLAAPMLVALLAPQPAVSAVGLLGLVVNATMVLAARRAPAGLRRETGVLLGWAVVGLPIGALALARVPADVVRIGIAALVLAALRQRHLAGPVAWRIPAAAAGLLAGALTTSTGLNGPPLVLRLTGEDTTPSARRHTLAVLFLALGTLGVATLAVGGQLRPPDVLPTLAAATAAGALVGVHAARRLASRIDERLVTALLFVAAAAALVSVIV